MTAMESASTAPAAGGRSRYHLSEEQVRFYDEHGYLVLRDWIPAPLLERLRAASEGWMERARRAGPDDPHPRDYQFARLPQGRVMFRVSHLHDKGEPASLELLGSPAVLAVAESLCGPNLVSTGEWLVLKPEGHGANVPWHQDAVHPRNYRIFNYGLYLDHSRGGGGALRIVPGTQRRRQDICASVSAYGWEPPGVVEVELAPGDVLLHDVMLVHGSPEVEGNELRRTIYYEFRSVEQILSEGPWDREFVDRRLRLVPPALRCHREMYPDAEQFEWRIADEYRPRQADHEETELRIVHPGRVEGTYCSAGSVGGRSGRV